MYGIGFHDRGSQGMKTASHPLETAFFPQSYEVQEAPRYIMERRALLIYSAQAQRCVQVTVEF